MSKGMSRKTPLGVGCWKGTDGSSRVSTGVPLNGLEEGVTAMSKRLGGRHSDSREGSLPQDTCRCRGSHTLQPLSLRPRANSQVHCVFRGAFRAPFKH